MRRLLAGVIVLATLLGAGLLACSGTSSTTLPPTTGILIRAETLTSGRGCGKAPTQLFKYAVVVFGYAGGPEKDRGSYTLPVTSNVFDCYTDGAFISLQTPSDNPSFRLEVYGYNEPAFTAARAAIEGAGTNTTALRATTPTWTTECTATQQQNVQALASCDTLVAGLSGLPGLGADAGATTIMLATERFQLADGRVATCGAAQDPGDAGADASDDAASDAGDAAAEAAAPVDAGPITFQRVRVRPRINASVAGPSVDLPCPTPYVAEVAAEPTRYELDVALLDPAGDLVGAGAQTICTVTSQPGAASSAVCP